MKFHGISGLDQPMGPQKIRVERQSSVFAFYYIKTVFLQRQVANMVSQWKMTFSKAMLQGLQCF